MSETNQETILIRIEVDQAKTQEEVESLKTQLDFLRSAAKGLQKDLDSGSITNKEYGAAMGRINDQSKRLTTELNQQEKALGKQKQNADLVTGSMKGLANVQSQLKEQYLGLSKSERENEQVGGALLQRIHSLNKEYEENNKKLTTSKRTVVDFVRELQPFGINIGKTFDAFKASGQSVTGFVKGLGSIKNAIAATGIGLLLLALGALYTYLTRSQDAIDFLARKTAGISAVFQKLTSIVITVGEKIFNAVNSPKAAIKELADFVGTNLTNRFRAFGVILDGIITRNWRAAIDGVLQLGTGITDATGKAAAFVSGLNSVRRGAEGVALETQKIRDAEIELNVERARSRAKIEELKKLSEDTTKSTQQRDRAAQQAYNLENSLLERTIDLQKRKIASIKAENATQKQGGVEARKAVAEEEIKLSELVEESLGKQTELQNSLNSIRKEGADAALTSQRKAANEEVAYWERALIQAKRNKEDTLDIEEQLVRLRAKAALIDTSSTDKKGQQERLLIEAKAQADILELRTQKAIETTARFTSIKQSEIKALLALVKEGTTAELELNKALIRTEAEQQTDQAKATIHNKEELDAKIRQIDAETKRKLLDADKAFLASQIELTQKRAELQQKIAGDLLARFKRDQAVRLSDQQAENDSALALAKEGSKAELDAQTKAINDRVNRELQGENLTQKARKAIVDIGNREVEDLQKRYILKTIDTISSTLERANAAISALVNAQSQRMLDELEQQQDLALKSAGTNADLRANIEKDYATKRIELEKQVAEKKKRFASVENIINTAASITKSFVEFGPILGAIFAAIALASGLAQQQIIDSQKFAKGGFLDGPSHQQGGIKYMIGRRRVELEGGEAVINKRSTQKHYDLLSTINQEEGGVAFPKRAYAYHSLLDSQSIKPVIYGSPLHGFAQRHILSDGGITPSSVAGTGVDARQLAAMIEDGITNALTNQKAPIVAVTDIHMVERDISRLAKRISVK